MAREEHVPRPLMSRSSAHTLQRGRRRGGQARRGNAPLIDVDIFGEEAWWAVLDDADLRDFGSDWRRVYEILPEVAGPLCPKVHDTWTKRIFEPGHYDTMRSYFKTDLPEYKKIDLKHGKETEMLLSRKLR
jgi:hypothetical protein